MTHCDFYGLPLFHGDVVIPSPTHPTPGVWAAPIGILVGSGYNGFRDCVRIHRIGRKTPTTYHPSFWIRADHDTVLHFIKRGIIPAELLTPDAWEPPNQ